MTQCNGTDIGLTLPTVPATVALPQGVTVPPGDEVYGADIRMAWDKESGDQTDRHGTLYVIGHPGATSVGCYQTSNNPSGLNEVLIQPDNGIYSEGAMIVPPGDRGNCNDLTALECGDIEDSASRTAVPTGTPSVTVTALVVQGPLPAKGYLQGSLPADDSKPVVELIVENRNSDRGGTSSGFSGVIACSLDSAADCSATLPYFLTQASLGSPMTSADYTQAFTKISAVIHSLN